MKGKLKLMKKSLLKTIAMPIFYLVVIVLVISQAFKFNTFLGVAVVLALIFAIIYTKRADIYSLKAQMSFNTDSKKSFELFEKAYKTGKLKPNVALFYAYLILRDGRLDEAKAKIDEILQNSKSKLTDTDKNNAKLNLAIIKWKSNSLKDAIKMGEEIYSSGFKTTALYGTLGYWYILDKNYQKALEFNKEAVDYNSTDLVILDNLAQNYYFLGDIEKSYQMYEEILQKNPTFVEPYYNFALVLIKKGENERVAELLQKALDMPEKFLSNVSHKEISELLEKQSI